MNVAPFQFQHDIIPQPTHIEPVPGVFAIHSDTIVTPDARSERTALYLAAVLYPATGFRLRVQAGMLPWPTNVIRIQLDPLLSEWGGEGYELSIQPREVQIRSAGLAGLFYACQTFRQLLPKEILSPSRGPARAWTVPCMTIRDWPRFPWRGLMLDVARHYLPKDFILRCVDLLALYKMNRLHLHLSDAQAWTLEIRRYPRLTDPGTRMIEPGRAPGTYSQKDMRYIVEYAAARHVMLIPEFDLPAHSRAALNAYPEFLCAHLPRASQGQQEHGEFCAGRDDVYGFIENVMGEMTEVFDAPYIHIGGDEYSGMSWADCPDCRRRIQTEQLEAEDTPELQALFKRCQGSPRKYLLYRYMMRRVAGIVLAGNRIPILWDDLSWRGSYPEDSVVMQWHYKGLHDWMQDTRTLQDPAVEAARAGHPVIAAPASHLYFDYCDGGALLERLYDFEPAPRDLAESETRYALGPHACLWENPQEKIDEMLFPRLLVLAEQGWTAQHLRLWSQFAPRLREHYPRLDVLGVQYADTADRAVLSQEGLTLTWDVPALTNCKKEWLINGVVTGRGCYELAVRRLSGRESTTIAVSWFEDGYSAVPLGEFHPADAGIAGSVELRLTVPEYLPDSLYYVRVLLRGDGKSACRGEIAIRKATRQGP